jgi:hypothetical protein
MATGDFFASTWPPTAQFVQRLRLGAMSGSWLRGGFRTSGVSR